MKTQTQNIALKAGQVFQTASDNTFLKVIKKHGTGFIVLVIDNDNEVEYEVFAMKKDIIEFGEVDPKSLDKSKVRTKINKTEILILSQIRKMEKKSDDGQIESSGIAVDGLNKFQVAGHISILDKKGLISLDKKSSKKKMISESAFSKSIFDRV